MISLKNTFVLFITVFSSFLFLLCSCDTNKKEVMDMYKKTIVPSQTGQGITFLYSDSTVLKIKLQAPQMLMYDKHVKEPLTILPKGLFMIFYDEKGKQTSTLKANYGLRFEQSKRMEVKYNVEIVNVNAEKLNTEHLIWDEQKKQITSDAFVKITTAKQIILGKGLVSNQDFTKYDIKEITGTIAVDNNNQL